MGLAIKTTKKMESRREYESGYLCTRCFDSIKKYLALKEKLESIRKDLQSKSKISLRLHITWIACALHGIAQYLLDLSLMQSRVKRPP